MGEWELAINDEFGVCPSCGTVNPKHYKKCYKCRSSSPFRSLNYSNEGKVGCLGTIVAFIIFVFLFSYNSDGVLSTFFLCMWAVFFFIYSYSNRSLQKKREEEARALYSRLQSEKADLAKRTYKKALEEFSNSNYKGAIATIEAAGLENSIDDDATLLLADSYIKIHNSEKAITLLEKLWQKKKTKPCAEKLALAVMNSGISSDKQIGYLLEAKEIVGPKQKSDIILFLARYYSKKDVEETIGANEIIQKAVEIDPTDIVILKRLCQNLLADGRYTEIKQYYSNISFRQHDEESIIQYATVLDKLNDNSPEAIKIYEKALQEDNSNLDLINRLGRSFMINKNLTKAINIFNLGLKNHPQDDRLRYNLALCFIADDKISDGIKHLQDILRSPSDPPVIPESVVRSQLGRCFLNQELYDLALNQYLLADRTEDSLKSLYKLGLYFENVDRQKAQRCWEEIYSTDIAYKDVAQKLTS